MGGERKEEEEKNGEHTHTAALQLRRTAPAAPVMHTHKTQCSASLVLALSAAAGLIHRYICGLDVCSTCSVLVRFANKSVCSWQRVRLLEQQIAHVQLFLFL